MTLFLASFCFGGKCRASDRWSETQQKTNCEKKVNQKCKIITILQKMKQTQDGETKKKQTNNEDDIQICQQTQSEDSMIA